MLKLPALRGQLRDIVSDTITDLFESYDLATTALDRFRLKESADLVHIREYEEICDEIEREVSRYCAEMNRNPAAKP